MNTQFHIRQANSTEYDDICSLIFELDQHHLRARPGVFRTLIGATRGPAFIASLITGPDSTILVADHHDEGLVGLVILIKKSIPDSVVRDARCFVEIDNLIVRSGMRRLGIAQSLISASKSWAEGRGVQSFEVTAWSFNAGAKAFYQKLGFQPTYERFELPLTHS
jgi:GNAT superfamily N-acetyltransferase